MAKGEAAVARLVDELIEREGGYVNHPADRGGPTCWGITEAVARAHGYAGAMRALPRVEAAAIYRRLYWLRPRFDAIAERSVRLAEELFDTGANMGPAVAATFLQRALTALNRGGRDYPDLTPDGRIGATTLAALDAFLRIRGSASGETVLLRALEALQGERYLRLAERRPANEAFLYGWLANRIGTTSAIIYLTKQALERSIIQSWTTFSHPASSTLLQLANTLRASAGLTARSAPIAG